MKKLKDLGYVYTNKDHRKVHRFLCHCGNIKEIPLRNVVSGNTKSCGCLLKNNKFNLKHGFRNHKLYGVYINMMSRCYLKTNKEYKNYGGRRIKVCDSWKKNIGKFIADMGDRPKGFSLDRIDNNKGYSKENCRWATNGQQARNKRNNVKYRGECAIDAAKRLGGGKSLVIMRIWKSKWSIKKAFTTPIKTYDNK